MGSLVPQVKKPRLEAGQPTLALNSCRGHNIDLKTPKRLKVPSDLINLPKHMLILDYVDPSFILADMNMSYILAFQTSLLFFYQAQDWVDS